MGFLLLSDAQENPRVFRWDGPVPPAVVESWLAAGPWRVPEELIDLWTQLGGAAAFESEELLPSACRPRTSASRHGGFGQRSSTRSPGPPKGREAMSTTHSGQVLVVTLTEIDVANAEVFRSELATAVNRYLDTPNADGAPLSIDLAAVRFLDSTALGAILDADRAVRAAGRRLDLVGVQTTVRRVFEVTGVWDHLHATRPSGHLPWHRGLR